MKLHVGGKFVKDPKLRYVGGSVVHIDNVEGFNFDLRDVDAWALRSGYEVGSMLFYGFTAHYSDLSSGLDPLLNDEHLQYFRKICVEETYVESFIESNP